jgi:hypothetical protein
VRTHNARLSYGRMIELDEGKVVRRKPVAVHSHSTTLSDPLEEPLDPVAIAVEIRAEAHRIAAISFGGCWPRRPLASALIQSAS